MKEFKTNTKAIVPTLPNFRINSYEDCVAAAKICVVRLSSYRLFIAELALKACEIRHGGGGHWNGFVDQKTIMSFAKDIGIHGKTLSEWISFKRVVVDKLGSEKIDVTNYKLMRRVHDEVRKQSGQKQLGAASTVDPKLVQQIYDFEKDRDLEGDEIMKALKYIKNIHHNVNVKWKMQARYKRDLLLLAEYSEEIVKMIDEKFKVNKKFAKAGNICRIE